MALIYNHNNIHFGVVLVVFGAAIYGASQKIYLLYCDSLHESSEPAISRTKLILNILYKVKFGTEPNFNYKKIIVQVQKQREADEEWKVGTDCGLHSALYIFALTIYLEDYEWTDESPCHHPDNIANRLINNLLKPISYLDTIRLRAYASEKINE